MKNVRPRYLALAGLVAAVVAGLIFVRSFAPLEVDVVSPVEKAEIRVFGLGTVEARVVVKVGFEAGGTLVHLYADHGDALKAGAIVARLDDKEQAARLSRADAVVESAAAAAEAAEAAVAKARAVLVQRRLSNERVQKLFAKLTVSAETAEQARMQQQSAEADLAVALSNVKVAGAALSEAKAQRRFEQILLNQQVLRAPFDAVVFERHEEIGAVVGPGKPIFSLVDPASVWVLAYIDEASAGDVRLGQLARIKLRSLPAREFTGRVVRIGIESDRVSEERCVYVACGDCPADFHLGEQAEVQITVATLENALLVPERAVRGYDGQHGVVWTVDGGRLRLQTVTFGHRTLDARLEVVDGVPAGARVVAAASKGLREGRRALTEWRGPE